MKNLYTAQNLLMSELADDVLIVAVWAGCRDNNPDRASCFLRGELWEQKMKDRNYDYVAFNEHDSFYIAAKMKDGTIQALEPIINDIYGKYRGKSREEIFRDE